MDFEKMLEQELERNKELRKVLDTPEKKAAYLEKIKDSWDEKVGYSSGDEKKVANYCKTCIFSHGDPPFADLPEKAYCRIYGKADSKGKPPEVLYEGARCEFYEKRK